MIKNRTPYVPTRSATPYGVVAALAFQSRDSRKAFEIGLNASGIGTKAELSLLRQEGPLLALRFGIYPHFSTNGTQSSTNGTQSNVRKFVYALEYY
jgi:hypothetical protein